MEIISKRELGAALPNGKFTWGVLAPFLMRSLKLTELNKLYHSTFGLEGIAFINAVLKELDITFKIDPLDLKNIPAKGAFIVVANHPYGGLDGLLMLRLLLEARPDFKVLANQLLLKLPGMQKSLIPVDPFKPENRKNIPGLRKVLEHLNNDMPVGIFPAGEVSSFNFQNKKVTDPDWEIATKRLIDLAKVPVIPMHFSGKNSLSFQLAGLVNSSLRTARLPAELFNKKGLNIEVRIGKPISGAELQHIPEENRLSYLRARTYALNREVENLSVLKKILKNEELQESLVAETHSNEIAAELNNLPSSALLFAQDQFKVYLAKKEEIPNTLQEIGRLRELTFREAGEGTGRKTDLDWYDDYYHHLFVYDKKARLLVGAYRIGEGQELYRNFGKRGFYLHSLFKMRAPFVEILNQSVELGRSFVRQEYQKKTLPLLLLWKGISVFMEQNPDYKYLIGPVSISNFFSSFSKALMVDFILDHFYDRELAQYVRPRKKFRYRLSETTSRKILQQSLTNIASLNDLVNKIEARQAGMPILLKKYLKQNARIIGFNIDPNFSNALDGFMIMEVKNLSETTKQLFDRLNKTV